MTGEAPDDLAELIEQRGHDRRKTAHHEAGHLAVAWALGGFLCACDIVPNGRFGGSALFRLGGDGYSASVERIVSTLAGPVAQRRFAPFEPDGGERDHEQVAAHLDALCRDPAAAAIVLRHCRAEAARLVSANWDAVEAIAAALLERETLTGDELDAVLAGVAEARRRVRWREIEARTQAARTHDTRTTA